MQELSMTDGLLIVGALLLGLLGACCVLSCCLCGDKPHTQNSSRDSNGDSTLQTKPSVRTIESVKTGTTGTTKTSNDDHESADETTAKDSPATTTTDGDND